MHLLLSDASNGYLLTYLIMMMMAMTLTIMRMLQFPVSCF